MKTIDIFGYSFSAIKLRKLRAALTTLGVIIGIAAIVALLSITQGLQATITHSLNQGLSANTLIVTPGSSRFRKCSKWRWQHQVAVWVAGGQVGGGAGGFGGGNARFRVSIYTLIIQAKLTLCRQISVMSFAVIQRTGYIEAAGIKQFSYYLRRRFQPVCSAVSATTFVAASGTIPLNPTDNEIVVGTRVNDPGQNGTILFNAGDNVGIVWTNATTLPVS